MKVKDYIEKLLYSLRPSYKKTSHTISLSCPDNIEINSYPGSFSQIITNLVMNSLIHGFEKNEGGKISIKIYIEGHTLVVCYNDNGKGMDQETLKKCFNPFFTTKRASGGTGLE